MDFDLSTVAQIAAVAWALGQFIFSFFSPSATIKRLIVLGICMTIGIVARVTGGGFESVPWLDFILQLIFAAMGAHLIHDNIANPALLRSRKK